MRLTQLVRWILSALTCAVFCVPAAAQPLPGAGALDTEGGEGHGWLVVGPASAPVLVHIPPRGSVELGDGRRISGGGGSVRLAAHLNSTPEAIAARGRSVYLIFGPGGGQRRLVLRASVGPASVGNAWEADQQERLDAMPSLDAPGRLLGFVGADAGVAALLGDGDGQKKLYVLRGERWQPETLPPGVAVMAGARLVGLPGEIGVYAESAGGEATLWRGVGDGASAGALAWTGEPMPAIGLEGENAPRSLAWVGGGLVYCAPTPGGLSVRQARPSGVFTLAVLADVGERFAVAPLARSGRLVVVWAQVKADARALGRNRAGLPPEERAYFVREVSAYTGRVLYDGPPASAWPFSLLEFRILAVLLMAIVVGVLVFVLRPDEGDGTVLLPTNTALAEPWRRAMAGAIDLTVAWLVVSWMTGTTLESLFVPVFGGGMVAAVLLVVAVGCLHCTLGEWAFGRSVGKAVAGCRVVVVGVAGDAAAGDAPPRAPPLRAALVRNLVRWGVAPLGLAALGTSDGRHRGDILARTAVVVEIEPELGGDF